MNNLHDVCFNKPITKWDEAIPLGNGLTGSLIWGDGSPLRISLDRGDLWDTRIAPEWLREDCTYAELIKLVKAGDKASIIERFEEPYSKYAYPTKIPAGRIELDFGSKCTCFDGRLSIADASADINMGFEGSACQISAFLHSAKGYGRLLIKNAQPKINLIAHKFSQDLGEKVSSDSCRALGYPKAQIGKEGNIQWFRQKTCEELEFAVITNNAVNGNNTDIIYIIASSNDGQDWFEKAKSTVSQAIKLSFEDDFNDHKVWWLDFWSKSSICLPDKQTEKIWYVNNYLFGSCSRKSCPPMPLQGVWTADEDKLPPWKGDYHNDLNTQMSYWHYLKANHIEEGASFVDFLWSLRDAAREFARKFYQAPGLCFPAVMTIDGKPLGGWAMYTLSIPNHIWLCQAFVRHWEYTCDRQFLGEKAYPFLKESAQCILHWLKPDKDGKLILPLSASPEIYNNELNSWLTPNSNHDLAIIRYLFKNLLVMSQELGENQDTKLWQNTINQLPELSIDKDNVLMLCPDKSLFESHRHHAHAMSIYPLELLDYHSCPRDKEVIDATITNLEILGTGWWVGFSFPWMAAFYTCQGNGQGASYQLKLFWECFCSQNGFNLNGDFKKRGLSYFHYRPFTLEGNMAAADAIQEMLLQTRGGVIRIFPAVPDDWFENGISFSHLRAIGGVLVSAEADKDGLKRIVLESSRDCVVKIVNSFSSSQIRIKAEKEIKDINCPIGDIFEVGLKSNINCIITNILNMGVKDDKQRKNVKSIKPSKA